MNSTETYWSVDDVSLQTYATNITTLGESRMAPPPLRGSDITIPYAPGRFWTPKVADSRTVSLAMWVIGATEDGDVPTEHTQREIFEANWRKLRNLLWTPNRQVDLTKRFKVFGDDTWYTATAKAQFTGGLSPAMTGDARATFVVDLYLADPFFYSEEISVPLPFGVQKSVEVVGDVRTTNMLIDFYGSLKNPAITLDGKNPVTFIYNVDIPENESATLRPQLFSARQFFAGDFLDKNYPKGLVRDRSGYKFYPVPQEFTKTQIKGLLDIPNNFNDFEPGSQLYPVDSIYYNSSGSVEHSGDPFWFFLEPGANSFYASYAGQGNGKVFIRYKPAWL